VFINCVFRIMFGCSLRPTGTMEIFVSLNDRSVKSFLLLQNVTGLALKNQNVVKFN